MQMISKRFGLVPALTIVALALVLTPLFTLSGQNSGIANRWDAVSAGPSSITTPPGEFSRARKVTSPVLFSNFQRRRLHTGVPKSKKSNGGPIFFNPETYLSGGVYAFSVAVGDFNGDGNADLAIVNECSENNCNSGTVSVLLGNGDGTFQAAKSFSSGGYEAFAVATADVNKDGKADLIVANGCQSTSQCANGVVGVLLGNGDGTFQSAKTYASGGVVASSVAIADVNGDGNPDLLVANQCLNTNCTSGGVSVLLGNGNGTFQTAQSYATGGLTAVSVAVGNFNSGKNIDLAVANQCQSSGTCNGNVGILLGNGNGTFQSVQTYASGGAPAVSVATGDFNGDGETDLVVANQCQSGGSCSVGNVGVLMGNGNGTFQHAKTYASGGNNTAAVAVAALTANGPTDLVLSNQCQMSTNCNAGSISVLMGNGDGTFKSPQNYISDGVFSNSVGVGNWNSDGMTDLAIVNQCQSTTSCSGAVTILLGNGNGTFQVPPTYASGGYDADSVAVGDLNGDGNADLVVANFCQSNNCSKGTNGAVSVFLGNGDGTFQAAHEYATGGFGSSSVAIGDFNGDGHPDVAVAGECSTSACDRGGTVSILLGNGDGTLQPAKNYSSGGYTSLSVAIADFNNDGNLDLAIANECQSTSCQNGSVTVLLGNGNGTFQTAQSFPSAGYETNFVATGDFNEDGNPDLVLTSQCQDSTCTNGGVSVLLGNGNGTFQRAQSYSSSGLGANSVAVADVNGDGKPDLVISNLCQNSDDCTTGSIQTLIGEKNGTFYQGHGYASGAPGTYSLVTADFNGDGNVDIVVANTGITSALLGNGDGTFQTPLLYFPGGIFVSTGIFTGNNKPDVVVAGGSLSSVTVLLNVVAGYRFATTTILASSPNPSAVDQSVLFTATIANQIGGSPTGTVTFKSGTTTLGKATVSNGQATLNYAFTSEGSSSIVAAYSGDSTFLPSSSAPLKQKVQRAPTTTFLISSPNPSQSGQTVTFTASVTGQFGGTPTGTVTFKEGETQLAQVPLTDGVAKYKTSTLTEGTHHVRANYSGDSNYQFSQGFVTQVVQ
jgi:hypothetical protein